MIHSSKSRAFLGVNVQQMLKINARRLCELFPSFSEQKSVPEACVHTRPSDMRIHTPYMHACTPTLHPCVHTRPTPNTRAQRHSLLPTIASWVT